MSGHGSGSVKAAKKVDRWLKDEDYYASRYTKEPQPVEPDRLATIIENEVPELWRQYQAVRRTGELRPASSHILKACDAARMAVVFTEMERGTPAKAASDSTLGVLNFVRTEQLPILSIRQVISELDKPFEEVVGGLDYSYENRRRSVMPVYVKLFELASAHLVDSEWRKQGMFLPNNRRPNDEQLLFAGPHF